MLLYDCPPLWSPGVCDKMRSVLCSGVFFLLITLSIHSPAVLGQIGTSCAQIIPESPVVNLQYSFTAYCIVNVSCVREDASKVYWKIKHEKVPESQYKVINNTVSSVTFENVSMLDSPLTCNYKVHGQIEVPLHGIFLTLGYPPDKPTNLTCIMYNDEKMICTWNPGRPTLLSTNYTLKHKWGGGSDQPDCIPQGVNYSCTISKNPSNLFYINNVFFVEATNALGTVLSDEMVLDADDVVKPNAPVIKSLISTAELPNALKVVWDNPMNKMPDMKFKYIIRYKTVNSSEWAEVPPGDTATHRTSFTLQSLLPYMEYSVSLRCKKENDKGYWSEWSEEVRAITPEAKPRKGPELWRLIHDANSEGKRHFQLMWKTLDPWNANGEIYKYTVAIKGRVRKSLEVNGTSYEDILPNEATNATVTAHNSAGVSPPSRLVLPSSKIYKVLSPEIDVKAFPKDQRLWVEWTPLNKSLDGYVIEWCVKSEKNPCIMEWQREPNNAKGAFLRGHIEALKCYLIKVYPLYADGSERPKSVDAYIEQGAPSVAPGVSTKVVEKYKALLVWNPISVDDQHGFIINYSLTYKASNRNASSVTINPLSTEYTLTSLAADTLYTVHMTAYTEKGGTDGPVITFRTGQFARGEVEAIVVSSCIAFLVFLLIGILLCFSKRDLIKKYIWPYVPDPSKSDIARWSPPTPGRHEFNTEGNLFQDGSFTDVSVVEITAEEKSTYTEQDIKPMDAQKKETTTSDGLSSGIGGSSCLSSRQSVSDSDEVESVQNTSGTVQYSTVILSGYRDQQPTTVVPHTFSRSESTQPLLDSEERPDEQLVLEEENQPVVANQYFKQICQVEDNKDRLQAMHQDDVAEPDQGTTVGKNGVSEGLDDSQVHMPNGELKSYLPQIVRLGGYMPQ